MKNRKAKVKITIDILMTAGLLFLMGFQLWGDAAHEWAGAFMLLLFVAHHILNGSWYKNIGKGRYTPVPDVRIVSGKRFEAGASEDEVKDWLDELK